MLIKAHVSSEEKLFEYTIKQAEQFVKNNAVETLKSEFQNNNKELLDNL